MESANIIYLILIFVLPIMGLSLYYLRLYRHPLVVKLSADPSVLFTIPIENLRKVRQLLKRTHQLSTILAENNVSPSWLDNAINFVDISPLKRCHLLKNRLAANFESTEDAEVFKFQLNATFPLNLSNFIIYFPNNQTDIADIQLKLDFLTRYLQDVIIITFNLENQAVLRQLAENRATQWVVPNNRELTALLLHSQPSSIFVNLLTEQLIITRLSPYVTAGANTKFFFGREKFLAEIIQYPGNYFIVGGRQLGKSSLLKKIENYYQTQQRVKCYYLSLFNTNLLNALGDFLGLNIETCAKISLADLLNKLANFNGGKRYLFLIDEADEFIREETANNYPSLSYFRGLSEQGLCHFVFAGFWELYAATLDYQSPIRNFGKTIIINALEPSACKQLAKKPMEIFRIHYASEQLVEMILQQTGQRANLIAIVCDKLLKTLDNSQYILYEQNIKNALKSKEIQMALAGWTKLIDDEKAAQLDRIVVYATVPRGKFTQAEVMRFLDKKNYHYTPEKLRESLERLELAFIIRKTDNNYSFCIPLFRENLMSQGKDVISYLLKKELSNYN